MQFVEHVVPAGVHDFPAVRGNRTAHGIGQGVHEKFAVFENADEMLQQAKVALDVGVEAVAADQAAKVIDHPNAKPRTGTVVGFLVKSTVRTARSTELPTSTCRRASSKIASWARGGRWIR